MKNAVIVIVVLAVIGGGAFALTQKSDDKETKPSTTQSQTKEPAKTQEKTTSEQSTADTITYGNNGFSPGSVTVKSGATVTIKNTSSHPLQLDSDPHPTHTDNTELNVGMVDAGQSQTFTVTKKGSFGFHNHLNPSDTGTLVVE